MNLNLRQVTLIMSLVLALVASALAEEPKKVDNEVDWRTFCGKASQLAEETMLARQAGVSIQKMMDACQKDDLFESFVIRAYDTPRFSTAKHQKQAADDFRDRVYVECAREFQSKK